MPDSLNTLEQRRSDILSRMVQLGDFRSGSITAIQGRCGKPVALSGVWNFMGTVGQTTNHPIADVISRASPVMARTSV